MQSCVVQDPVQFFFYPRYHVIGEFGAEISTHALKQALFNLGR